ncbi:unnamed protein product [Cylicocyclus nassatus]|uniref:Serpentine receptor class gamma n=1 Tax=Cylicocyclus nassatus TaxID=53992 RepID=A0AA36MDQ6_CYLNA|nr:unnamed protein product [Cylicocyclus nassatus]
MLTNIIAFMDLFYVNLASNISTKSWLRFLYMNIPKLVSTVTHACTFHAVFMQTYMTFSISLFRMTLITHPTMHIMIWKFALPASVVVSLLTPLISTHKLFTADCYFKENAVIGNFSLVVDNNLLAVIMKELLSFMCLFTLFSLGINIASVIVLCIRTRNIRDIEAEKNMLILALLDFAVEAIVFGLLVVIYYNPGAFVLISKLVPHSMDILIFSNAYLIMILNKRIRQRVLALMRCSGKSDRRIATRPSIRSHKHGRVLVGRF